MFFQLFKKCLNFYDNTENIFLTMRIYYLKHSQEDSILSKCLLEDESEEEFYERLNKQFMLEYEEEKKKFNRKAAENIEED